jgi:hypothetical protein
MHVRANLPPLPLNMRSLRIDSRGYPVPFFVEWINGVPDFRVTSHGTMHRCVLLKLCWICGKPIGNRLKAFVIGPMCAINRISSEPPSHVECAEYAVQACPFMVLPKMRRREGGLPSNMEPPPGILFERNPGVMLVWIAHSLTVQRQDGGYLFNLGRPSKVLWYTEGRKATRDEVIASIESGLPFLSQYVTDDKDAAELEQLRSAAMKLIPKDEP